MPSKNTTKIITPKATIPNALKTPVEETLFTTAADYVEPALDEDIASPGQVKYARDLIQKEFGLDTGKARDVLAHLLELPLSEVPDVDTWDTTLTREMAGVILDTMERKRKRDSF